MRAALADVVHSLLRNLPAARNVYAQRDALAAALAATEAALRDAQALPAAAPAATPTPAATPSERFASLVAQSSLGMVAGHLLRLTEGGALGAAGDALVVPFDDVMYPIILRDRAWQAEELRFVAARVDPLRRYTLIDVGANIGLFARQAQRAISTIDSIVCIEADPGNFAALSYNLAHLPASMVALHHVALADRAGSMTWYRDARNFGNYSLNADAMRGQPFTSITVEAVETGAFFGAQLAPPAEARVVWKSDTQGYDEMIVTRLPDALWERVDLAILELWRIAKPDFDRDAFRRRIGDFAHRSIGVDRPASVEDVLAYLDGDDYGFDDLYLWR